MVGDHAQRFVVQISSAGHGCSRFDQALEDIDFIVAVHVLHNGSNTFHPHAGIHAWFWQRFHPTIGVAVELHKNVVPDLDETVAVFLW